MLQRLADLPRLLQLWALQHDGESHHFAPSMLALCLIFWNTQHAIHWNLLFTISSSSLSPSHSGDLQPSDRHGSKVLGPVVHLPDWGFKILFFFSRKSWQTFSALPLFQEILEKNIFYASTFPKIQPPIPPSPRSRRAWTRWWSPSGTWRNSRPASRYVGNDW